MFLLLALACNSEESLRADYNAVQCETLERCGDLQALGYESVDDCIETLDGLEVELCEDSFDADAAKTCISGWEALACESLATDQPAECQAFCAE
ncbi:MAG: hypothetical protein VX899_16270 [Myxococcota bacterium]|nr:hypothetical protein [Myxococcota bacterium]